MRIEDLLFGWHPAGLEGFESTFVSTGNTPVGVIERVKVIVEAINLAVHADPNYPKPHCCQVAGALSKVFTTLASPGLSDDQRLVFLAALDKTISVARTFVESERNRERNAQAATVTPGSTPS